MTSGTGFPYHGCIEFEWDEVKAAGNYSKHGISFDLAKDVFKDVFALEFPDDREDYGEHRFLIIGTAEKVLAQCDLYGEAGRCSANFSAKSDKQ